MTRRSHTWGVLALVLSAAVLLPTAAQAAFPGQNGKIAFSAQAGIHTVNPDGTGLAQLTTPSGSLLEASRPRWSPDGGRIAYRQDVRACNGTHDELCQTVSTIRVMNADGSGQTELRGNLFNVTALAWSPDGSRIAFSFSPTIYPPVDARVRVMNADGTDLQDLGFGNYPAWSPDGSRIAFIGQAQDGDHSKFEVFTMHPDGTERTRLTSQPQGQFDVFRAPSWSPDGSRLVAFTESEDRDLFTINADGTGYQNITNSSCFDPENECEMFPVWSPDGASILFVKLLPTTFATVRPDGSELTRLPDPGVTFSAFDQAIDWQSIPVTAYPRPKGATPTQVSLVPAYAQCTAPDRTHGSPLAFPSCASPVQASDELTLGTADSNGKPTKARGLVRYDAFPGVPATPADEADVQITVELSDVYRQDALADYTGELRAQTSLRITDKLNTPAPGGPGAATVSDATLSATVPCTATADTTEGASCNLVTTFDALVPGTVTETKRSIWALGAAQLDDGGADNDADTPGDNTLFMTQGIFVP